MVVVSSLRAAQQASCILPANLNPSFGPVSVSLRSAPCSPLDRGTCLTPTAGLRGLAGLGARDEAVPSSPPVIPTHEHAETEVRGEPFSTEGDHRPIEAVSGMT